jgi:hypothetical protein
MKRLLGHEGWKLGEVSEMPGTHGGEGGEGHQRGVVLDPQIGVVSDREGRRADSGPGWMIGGGIVVAKETTSSVTQGRI